MSAIWNIFFLTSVFCISSTIICAFPSPEETNEKNEDSSDSSEREPEKDIGTVSPTVMKELEEKILDNQEKDAEKFGLPITSSSKDVEDFLEKEEEKHGEDLPDRIEENFTEADDFRNFVNFLALFDQIESETSDTEEEVIKKSPEEMKKMREETFKLTNKLNERQGLPEVSHEEFDNVWNKKKEEYGEKFPGKIEKVILLLKTNEEEKEPKLPFKEIEESTTEASTSSSDISEEESSEGAFFVRNAKGKICILAKFESVISITYPGKTSEEKVEVTIPPSANAKGKCGGPNRSSSLQLSWGKFTFALMFDKTSEDLWSATSVELVYDKSVPLFDGAADRFALSFAFGLCVISAAQKVGRLLQRAKK